MAEQGSSGSQFVYTYVILDKDSLTPAGRTGRVELMQAIDLIFIDNLRRIMCKQAVYISVDITKPVYKELAY